MAGIHLGRKQSFFMALDVGLIVLALAIAYVVRFRMADAAVLPKVFSEWTGASVVVITVHLLAFYIFELYNLELDFRRVGNLLRCVGAVAAAALVVVLVSFLAPRWGFGRGMFGLHAVSLAAFTCASRALGSRVWEKREPPKKALLVSAQAVSDEVLKELATNLESELHLVGTVPVNNAPERPSSALRANTPPPLGTLRDLEKTLRERKIRDILVAGIDALPIDAGRELLRLKLSGFEVHDLAVLFQRLAGRLPLEHLNDAYFLREPAFTQDTRPVLSNFFRVMDVLVAAGLLVASSPLWALAFVGIKLTMPGPVLYSQERVGKDERPYTIFKFRSMVLDAERGGAQWSLPGDPRVTPFGRFLRRTRIDELPQLWNVLRGDMSLVGPRPEREVFVARLKQEVPYYALRFAIKPGLTGWAQVCYRYGASTDDARIKLSYDLYYVQERSVLLFVVILLKTVQTVLFKPGS
ncbi:MAG: sugar transferase [Deltaproteobacteria bacterium]|nr:sugar transferase [Deltaproteobacteria bacterium]